MPDTDDPGTVLASSLVRDSQVEDGHYKAKYEELRLRFENQQRILSDYEAKLFSREQVSYFYLFLFIIYNYPSIFSGEGGQQEAGARYQGLAKQQHSVM